jgi:hypothetical protein
VTYRPPPPYYILGDGKSLVDCHSSWTWDRWMTRNTNSCIVGRNAFHGVEIVTAFTGQDWRVGIGPPLTFRTTVAIKAWDVSEEHYRVIVHTETWEKARQVHVQTVERMKLPGLKIMNELERIASP